MAKTDNLNDFLKDVADAIREKKGTTAKINAQNFSLEISGIIPLKSQTKSITITNNGVTTISPSYGYNGLSSVTVTTNVVSSSAVSKSDVNFYDYDGTLLHSYTKAQFASLSSLPSRPSRSGLICQGWNYSLTDAKSYVSQYGKLDIGAMYITNDGKTRLYIRIAEKGRMTVPLYFSQTVANGVTIDWGDGSPTQTLSGTGNKNTTHTYANVGEYTITLNPTGGTLGLGYGSSSYCVMGATGNNGKVYCNMLQAVEIGRNVSSIGNYAFDYCFSLTSVTIPSSVSSIGNYAFRSCYSLASVTIPSSVSSIGSSVFTACHSLASVTIPSSVSSIGSSVFYTCYSLTSVTIPSRVSSINEQAFYQCRSLTSVTIPSRVSSINEQAFYQCYSLTSVTIPSRVSSIGSSVFTTCYGMAIYDFREATSVPTLSAANAFNTIPSDCKIVVPDSLYDSWIAATNWSTYASNIVKSSNFNG